MSRFSGDYRGYQFEVSTEPSALGTQATFSATVIPSRSYSTEEALEKAIDAFDLKQRKGFKNGSAWMAVPRYAWTAKGERVARVTVTSTEGDDEAWVKHEDGRRTKEARNSLFASKEALEWHTGELEALRETWEAAVKVVNARRELWTPEKI